VAVFREHGNEPSGFIKKARYFDKLNDNQLFKQCTVSWSK
jgi:hypothetical protein